MAENLRLFVALPLPESAQQDLVALQCQLPALKFARNPHLTLRFIGNVDCADTFAKALSEVAGKAFELRLTCIGLFRRNILWAGPDMCLPLAGLKLNVDAALASVGLKPEKRDFWPHLTLSRLREAASPLLLKAIEEVRVDISWQVEKFCLYRSILRPQGALHEEIAKYWLK